MRLKASALYTLNGDLYLLSDGWEFDLTSVGVAVNGFNYKTQKGVIIYSHQILKLETVPAESENESEGTEAQ